ncbi:MAG: putative bifunctional diguanylate cyclase/phosphodiesterase [Sphaerochaetaceae bacterium]
MVNFTKKIVKRTLLVVVLAIIFLLLYLQYVKLEQQSGLDKLIVEHTGHLGLIDYMVESRYHEYHSTLKLVANSNEFANYLEEFSTENREELKALLKRIASNRPYIKALQLKMGDKCEDNDCYISISDKDYEIESLIDLSYWERRASIKEQEAISSRLKITKDPQSGANQYEIALSYPLLEHGVLMGQLLMVVDGSDILNIIEHFLDVHPSEMGFILLDSGGSEVFYKSAINSIEQLPLLKEDSLKFSEAITNEKEGNFVGGTNHYYFVKIYPEKDRFTFYEGGFLATAMFYFSLDEVESLLDSILVRNKYVRWGFFASLLTVVVFAVLSLFSRRDDKVLLELSNIIYEKSHDGVLITDKNSNPLFINRTYRLMSAFSNKELKASPHKVISLSGNKVSTENIEELNSIVWVKGKRHSILLNLSVLSASDTYKDNEYLVYLYSNPINIGDAVVEGSLSYDSGIKEIESYPLKLLSEQKELNEQFVVISLKLTNMSSIESKYSIDEQYLLSSQIRKRISRAFDQNDTILQYSLNHYLLVLNVSDKSYLPLLEKLKDIFEKPFVINNNKIKLACQMGLSKVSNQEGDVEVLLRQSRIALASLNNLGNSDTAIYSYELDNRLVRNFEILKRFPDAIENKVIEVHYQPIINLRNNKIYSAEALSRWEDPHLRRVGPNEFIPVVEANNLEHLLYQYVLENVCRFLSQLEGNISVSVNLGYNELQDPNLINFITDRLNIYNIEPGRLKVELTERTLMSDIKRVKDILGDLREHNIKVALDDFGVGFSSLSYLHDLELDLIKIDRSFIKDYPANDDGIILKAMVRMAKELKIPTLIEGIETKEQLNFVKSLQVDFYQGFYFSKAVNEQEFKKLFKKTNLV